MKTVVACILTSLLMFVGLASAGESKIEIVLSPHLQDRLDSLDRIEKEREKDFRKYRHYDLHHGYTPEYSNKSRFASTQWANETLIPDIEDYGLKNLLQAMIEVNLSRVAPDDFTNTIRVTLEHISISDHPLAVISGGSYAKGKIEQIDSSTGEVISAFDITSNVSTGFTISNSYDGSGFAFHEIDEATRIGPTLASFVRHSLGKLFPDDKDKLAKPISVLVGTVSGVQTRHQSHLLRMNHLFRKDFYSRHYF